MMPDSFVENMQVSPEILLGRDLNETERKYSPKVLYVAGLMKYLGLGPRVSIVGTRNPTPEGRETARKLAASLAREGIVVISGLARGIDTEAHKGAMEISGGTMAGLGTPLDYFYPPENRDLQLKIRTEHILVSQFPQSQPVQKRNFVIRNRTMALLCDASIIVEAGDSSGTLSQGWEALRLGRPLFIWAPIFEAKGLDWPTQMVNFGAKRFSDASDVSTVFDEIPSKTMRLEVI